MTTRRNGVRQEEKVAFHAHVEVQPLDENHQSDWELHEQSLQKDEWIGMCERSESLQSLPHPGDVDDSAYEEKRGVEWGESGRAAGRGWKTHGTWIVRQVIRRAHHVQCYKGWYLVRLVSSEELDVGNWNGCTRWGTVHMTGNTRWISPIPAPVIEVIGRRHPVFMSFSTLTTWSNGGKCGSMWVMISPNPRYNSGCADNQ